MGLDLFAIIEKFFQGTILFLLKFLSTIALVFFHPVKNSLVAFGQFQSSQEREVGPTTFVAICISGFWATVIVILSIGSQQYQSDVLISELKALNASPLRVPIILTAVGTIATLVLLEVIYRLMVG